MKPKPPFQIVLLDDDGHEMMTAYVSNEPMPDKEVYNLNDCGDSSTLLDVISDTLRSNIPNGSPKWMCP